MEDPEVASGLFAIQLSSDDEDGDNNNGTSSVQETTKADRTGQSEAQFQHVKQTYRVKVESGELYNQIILPLTPPQPIPTAKQQQQLVSKPQAQALLHAVEELYFLRRYAEGADFVRRVFGDGGDQDENGDEAESQGGQEEEQQQRPRLDEDTRKTLRYYQKRCEERSRE